MRRPILSAALWGVFVMTGAHLCSGQGKAPISAATSFRHVVFGSKTQWNGASASCLSDGKTEAVVVPAFSGRVMHYGFIGGANWLWSAPPEKLGEGCKNWGGDKTFVGSHGAWKLFAPSIWLAQPTWDGEKHGAEILPNGGLRTIGPVWKGFGVRVIRSFAALFWRCGTLLQLQPGAYPKEEIER